MYDGGGPKPKGHLQLDSRHPDAQKQHPSWMLECKNPYQTGKLAQTVREMNVYNLGLLGVTEARWTKTGKQRLNPWEIIIWSGRKDENHQEGVALIISTNHANTLLQWKPINEAYAPIENADEDDKDQFYSVLQASLENIPRHDVLILMGDFNARVGNNNSNRERIMGRHGLGELTNNGEQLVSICEEYDLAIGGTLFAHKNIHKLTWTSPNGMTKSQMNHIIINNKWKRSLQDVRVMRNADVGSDHNLYREDWEVKRAARRTKRRYTEELAEEAEFAAHQQDMKTVYQATTQGSNADEDDKDQFYSVLQASLENIPRHDVLILMGDFNARVGNNNSNRERIMGRHGLGELTNNGERLVSICEEYDLAIGGTLFAHKNIHKLTWTSPNGHRYTEELAEEAEFAAHQQDMKTVYQATTQGSRSLPGYSSES
uniref:Craniofacial development protein 2-like n=1 Tax=Saccoglossus kowalevskii TaxID=10224 RepID=A0ABM0MH84_SACKO|nr:PREDICTED: craniofacial development protein 2-like [Saccoglossus kowalevskii]